ncbi:uncharacterized protein LOC115228431 [Octopus sinensis]|uniref:Uncharacterized protein LOC115228431 n=1 Tax=Octopus sinensis TaxID=2607531 RepID=A0A6P7TSZ9_9MOLL|nr:uncharacterized protein LOC115228431 [Octopus sinensis]
METANRDSIRERVNAQLLEGNVAGAVRVLASDAKALEITPQVLGELKTKHPNPPDDQRPLIAHSDLPNSHASKEEVLDAINSLATGSCGGIDGLRPGHVKDMLSNHTCEAGQRLLSSLTALTNRILNAEIPEHARDLFFAANLTALRKKEGGIRPIAMGCFYRRLASKVACRQATKLLGSELRPIQLGVGVSGGCEAAVHATRKFISASQNQPNNLHLLIKLDLINAFNSVRRDVIFESIIRRSPFIARLVALAYGRPSLFIAGDHSISSCNGVQQGDPLGPLLFVLAIDPVARSVSSVFNAWYLDDATIGGTLESVLDDLRILIPALHAIGLDINPRKSEIFNISYDVHRFSVAHCSIESLLPNIHVTSPGNLKILGSTIFHSGVVSTLSEKTSNLASMSCNLGIINSHSALFLLRNCFAIPKLLFTLRSAPCFANPESLSRFDHSLRTCLESICNAPFDDLGWEQAILPISHGGIGARSATDLFLPAFLSSTHATSTLVQEILQPFSESSLDTESVAAKSRWLGLSLELPQNPHAQVEWDRILCDQKLNNLKPKLNQHRLACLLAASQPYSGAWLTAIPMGSSGTLLDNDCLRIGIQCW